MAPAYKSCVTGYLEEAQHCFLEGDSRSLPCLECCSQLSTEPSVSEATQSIRTIGKQTFM